ncbi:MAG: cytochrome c [Bacteroidota bacterium]
MALYNCGCNPEVSQQVDQLATGTQLYTTYCASCHEVENGIGPRLTKEVVATRVNGQLLYNYNKRNMPYQAGNTLTPDQYWAITAYMLKRDGFMEEDVLLSAENAREVELME